MANQRIFLKCLSCGEEKMLAKRLISAFHVLHHEGTADDWDEWFKKHEWGFCGGYASGLDIFELVYEDPQEFELFPEGNNR